MRIPAWRAFLLGGLVAMAVYFLLPDTERVTAAYSAVLHCGSAVAVSAGSGGTDRPIPGRGT